MGMGQWDSGTAFTRTISLLMLFRPIAVMCPAPPVMQGAISRGKRGLQGVGLGLCQGAGVQMPPGSLPAPLQRGAPSTASCSHAALPLPWIQSLHGTRGWHQAAGGDGVGMAWGSQKGHSKEAGEFKYFKKVIKTLDNLFITGGN